MKIFVFLFFSLAIYRVSLCQSLSVIEQRQEIYNKILAAKEAQYHTLFDSLSGAVRDLPQDQIVASATVLFQYVENIDNPKLIVYGHRLMADAYYDLGQSVEAFSQIYRGYELALMNHWGKEAALMALSMGNFYLKEEFLEGACESYEEAERFFKTEGDNLQLFNSYHKLVHARYNLGQYQESIKNAWLAIKHFDLLQDASEHSTFDLMNAYNTLGLAYYYVSEYDSAINAYDKAHDLAVGLKHAYWMALTNGNKAQVYIQQRINYEQSIDYLYTEISQSAKIGDWGNNVFDLTLLANVFLDLGKPEVARRLMARADSVLEKYPLSHRTNLFIAKRKVTFFEKQGDFEMALAMQRDVTRLSDSLNNMNTRAKAKEYQLRYELEKKHSEITANMGQISYQQNIIWLVAIMLGIIVFAAIIIARNSRKLSELNKMKNKLFSILSHDLRGPLHSFTSFVELLMSGTDRVSKQEIKMVATELDKSLKNLFEMMENLLEWSSAQTGAIDFTPEPFDLAELVKRSVALLTLQAKNKNITIIDNVEGPLLVKAHHQSMGIVIHNLLSNAIKFTSEGGSVTLSAETDGKRCTIRVKDTGVGIGAKGLQNLFRIDRKYTTPGTANEKGTGLGLILCKDFVERNGGRIGVESAEGVGSSFNFSVPTRT